MDDPLWLLYVKDGLEYIYVQKTDLFSHSLLKLTYESKVKTEQCHQKIYASNLEVSIRFFYPLYSVNHCSAQDFLCSAFELDSLSSCFLFGSWNDEVSVVIFTMLHCYISQSK